MEDLRKIKSRDMLKKAFWTVLEHKKYTSITIKDIVESAGLNRKTFNAHYIDLDALRDDCIHELFIQLSACFQDYPENGSIDFALSTRNYIRFALDHRKQLQLIFDNNLDGVALHFWKYGNHSLPSHFCDGSIRHDLYANYAIYSCWGNLLWVLKYADELPFETLVEEALLVYRSYLENYYILYKD